MSIRPTAFNKDGSVTVWHDEANHGGVIDLAAPAFTRNHDGSEDLRFLSMACPEPGCGAISVHPASGGAAPEMVQELFARRYLADESHPAQTWEEAKAALKTAVAAMDGSDRFQIEALREDALVDTEVVASVLPDA